MNRWIGAAAAILMLSVNAALVMRDLVPGWTAGDPPRSTAFALEPGGKSETQFGISDAQGRSLGKSWSIAQRTGELLTIRSWTLFEPILLGQGTSVPLLIRTEFTYNAQSVLDLLTVNVGGLGVPVALRGEFVPPSEFPCEWQIDTQRGRFILPAQATRALAETTRPFESLSELYVGQTWRVELFNPLAAMLPGMQRREMAADTLVVSVTGREKVTFAGREVDVFVIEADRVKAWVSPDGQVLRQEVRLPIFGSITLTQEPFDDTLRRRATSRMYDD